MVLLFLAQGTEELEAAAFTDVIGWTRTYGLTPVGLTTVALHSQVRYAWNFTIVPERLLDNIDPAEFDAIAIPGGLGAKGFYEDVYDERLLALLRDFDTASKPIAAVCVGALPIAKSGVLRGRRATTYFLSDKRRAEMAELGAIVEDGPLVIDGNVITSTSPATALDVAFCLLGMLTDSANVARVKEGMGLAPMT